MFDKKHLEEGIALRRNTYRGKKLTADDKFYQSIEEGTFADIYVGDYIESKNVNYGTGTGEGTEKVRWLIADIDNYMNTGDGEGLQQHHVTIIPAKPLTTAKMNETNTTEGGGYANSAMVKVDATGAGSILENIYNTYIKPDFDGKVIEYRNLLTTKVTDTLTNRFGQNTGASSYHVWYPRKLDLMSEMNVYGGIVTSSSMYDTGIDNRQYAIFRLKPELINSYNGERFNDSYWLKDVATSTYFALVDSRGYSSSYLASISIGVRPRFLIG